MKLKIILIVAVLLLLNTIAIAQESHDSALFVVDVSNSLNTSDVAQGVKILKDMNSKFPDYVKTTGILTFGNYRFPMTLKPQWVSQVAPYDRNAIAQALDKITSENGRTPIADGLVGSEEGLDKSEGKTALIVVSDGVNNGVMDPVTQVKKMKDKHGNNLCVFTIQLRNSKIGADILEKIVKAGECGLAKKASGLSTDAEIKALVDYIFPPRITPTPTRTPTATPTPPLDSDKDGVIDDNDKCPGTPLGAKVDAEGCWRLQNVYFEFDSAKIKQVCEQSLDEVANVLKANPNVKVIIEGHTDSKGSDEYNLNLSQKRADSIKKYLVSKGIAAENLSTKGYGESKPIADNETDEGRAKNRRIELTVVK
ncbi:OmpA family protein [bacterium]|nr:OmpA family protein [bacterium]